MSTPETYSTLPTGDSHVDALDNENEPNEAAIEPNFTKTFTFEEGLDAVGTGSYQFNLLHVCGLGWMFDGVQLSIAPFIIPQLKENWNLTPVLSGSIGAVVFIGMMVGALLGGLISDKYGRKVVFIVALAIGCLGALGSAIAVEIYTFLITRFVVGLGLGATVPTDFSLFMEYIPSKNRGTLSVIMNLYWGAGFVLSVLSAWFFVTRFTYGWRFVCIIAVLPGLISLPFRIHCDESPRYLITTEQFKKVMDILIKIARKNRVSPEVLHGELKVPFSSHAHKSLVSKLMLLFSKQLALSTILLSAIWFLLTFTSYGFSFLIPIVFASQKQTDNIYIDSMIVSLANGVGYIITSVLMSRVRRRILLTVSLLLTSLFTAMVAISSNTTYIFLVAIFVSGMAAIPWATLYTYTPEVYPTVVRATGVGICSAFTRTGGAITPIFGEVLLAKHYAAPFLLFAASSLFAAIFSFLLPIETLGKDLSDDVENDEKPNSSFNTGAPLLVGREDDIESQEKSLLE